NGLVGIKKLSAEQTKEYEPHVKAVAGVFVPQTGIIDYTAVSKQYLKLIELGGGELKTGEKVLGIKETPDTIYVNTSNFNLSTKQLVNCSGLYADKIAQMTGQANDMSIIPFRGEYFFIKPEKEYLIKTLVYPVPNPEFPFLGVHFTRMIHGGLEAGPNAVLAFKREGYKKSDFDWKEFMDILKFPGFYKIIFKYWKEGLEEIYRSMSKSAFTQALQNLVPEINEDDLIPGGAGVRAQACSSEGKLLDDFLILEKPGIINVCNAPSPAATASLSIGKTIAEMVLKNQSV
ncbi:MAG TPA: L-2-hydroxyglutarate oxidase, partial [Saprospiraceae bacterium]|nr:L-2-hydroxyglutarate oxidase [Saprospiraceae bacterium]